MKEIFFYTTHQLLLYHHLYNNIDITDFLFSMPLDQIILVDTDFTINIGYNIYINKTYTKTMLRNGICYEILDGCDLYGLYKCLQKNKFIKSNFKIKLRSYVAGPSNGIINYLDSKQLIVTKK